MALFRLTAAATLALCIGAVSLSADTTAADLISEKKPLLSDSQQPAIDPKPVDPKPVDPKPVDRKPDAKPPKEPEKLTTHQEARSWAFVTEQHPELADVLSRLKTTDPAEYERALHQILITSDRIAQLAKNDPPRGKLELRQWKIDSRIRLMAAHMTLSPAEASEAELRAAVNEQVQIKLEALELDRARAEAKLKNVDSSIAKLKSGKDQEVETRLIELHAEIAKANSRAARDPMDTTPK